MRPRPSSPPTLPPPPIQLCVVNKGPVTITIDDIATVLKQRDSIVVNNGEVHDLKPGAQYMSVRLTASTTLSTRSS